MARSPSRRAAAREGGWSTIESDPGVFTELIERFGVRGVQVEEVYSLGTGDGGDDDDDEELARLAPVYGLVFLFRYEAALAAPLDPSAVLVPDTTPPPLFFAKQIIHNACATQAILSVLLNSCGERDGADGVGLDIGDELRHFHDFVREFDPATRGEAISNAHVIRTVHNSFAPSHGFALEQDDGDDGEEEEERQGATPREDAFHFISYVPMHGRVYELNGLQEGPVDLGAAPDGRGSGVEWTRVACAAIRRRISRYQGADIRFSLQAVCGDRREAARAAGDAEMAAAEERKRASWRRENELRCANLVPFGVALLKRLAETGALDTLVEQARQRQRQRRR